MAENVKDNNVIEFPGLAREDHLREAEATSGIGLFEVDLSTGVWRCSAQVAKLFGFAPKNLQFPFSEWDRVIFADDVSKLQSAFQGAVESGSYYVEFRVTHSDQSVHWLA